MSEAGALMWRIAPQTVTLLTTWRLKVKLLVLLASTTAHFFTGNDWCPGLAIPSIWRLM